VASNTGAPGPVSSAMTYEPASTPSSMGLPAGLRSSATSAPPASRTVMRPASSGASTRLACVVRTSVTTMSPVPARSNSYAACCGPPFVRSVRASVSAEAN
jgi:hypothetical protein